MKKYISLLGAVFVLLSVLLVVSCSTPNSFENAVTSGNYTNAIAIYENKISGNSSKELEAKNFLLTYMQSTLTNYAEGQIDTSHTESVFACLIKLDDHLYLLNTELGRAYEKFTALQSSKETFELAMAAFNTRDYESAMLQFAKVNEADTENYLMAQEQLETSRNEYKAEIYLKLQTALEASEYDHVISLGGEAMDTLGEEDIDLQNLVDSAYYQKADVSISSYIQEGSLDLAIQTYQTFADLHSNLLAADLTEKMSIYKEEFVNQIIETSKTKYFEIGAEVALQEINKGLLILEDKRLEALHQLYLSAIAVSWKDVTHHIPESGIVTHFSTASDYWGNTYNGDLIKFYTFWGHDYPPLEIVPNQNYSHFIATIFPDKNFSSRERAELKIYGDGILIYEKGDIDQKTKAIDIDIDITNVEVLEIQLTDGVGESRVWLQNATFCRELTEEDIQNAILF